MENDEILEAGARIKSQNEMHPRDDKSGAHASVAAFAGVVQQPPPAYEDTPLLSTREEAGRLWPEGEDGDDGELREAPAGLEDDFAHLPWWRRPSVGYLKHWVML